ncbi:hypothetical protein TRFO_24322 [Tritrichomonas foetus]|uniref:Uncharacterized protein n=1 Tax=Tritrichomonas foetus TaxID=1144522 RepID=A0A1J4K8A0_9EUKA|nr:hypothetical protein TRFO_24322 [Tritrichomonas foetus]|eukprot:OHT07435.1 hypothetical protein TRFO_24322 [Tritrichomonas foetus]
METSHSETEKALKAEIEQLKIHSIDVSKTKDLEQEIQHQKNQNDQLMKEVLEKTEKLRTFYDMQANLEDKTEECENWKKKYEETTNTYQTDSQLLEQIEKLKKENENLKTKNENLTKENESLKQTNSSLLQENTASKKTITDKNTILKQSLSCIEKLQHNIQNKDSEIAALKDQINKIDNKENNSKLVALIEKQKKQISLLMKDNESKNKNIIELKRENEEIQEKFTRFTKVAESQIQEANSFAQRQVEEAKMHAQVREDLAKQQIEKANQQINTNKGSAGNNDDKEQENVEQQGKRQPTEIEMKVIAESIKLKAANSDLQTKNYILQTKVDEQISQMKKIASSFARAKEEIKEYKEAIKSKTAELSKINTEMETLRNENREKSEENASLTKSLRKLIQQRENKDESTKRLTALLDENTMLETKVNKLSDENEKQKNTINHLKIEIDPLNKQVTTLKDQLTKAKREIMELQTSKREIQVRMTSEQAEFHEQNSNLLLKIEELESHIDSIKKEKAKTELILKDTMDEYEKEVKEITEKAEKSRQASEKIVTSIDSANQKLQSDLDAERNNLKLEKLKVKEYLKQIDSLAAQIKTENAKRLKQNELVEELKDEINEYHNDFKQIIFAIYQEGDSRPTNVILQEIRRLKSLLEQLTETNLHQANENDALKSKIENDKIKFTNIMDKVSHLKQELMISRQSKSENENNLLGKIEELQNKIRTNETQHQILMKKIQSQLSQQIETVQADLSAETHKKEVINKKYEETRSAYLSLQQDYEKSQELITSLQNDFESIRKEKSDLIEELKITKGGKKQMIDKLNQLQERYEKTGHDTQEILMENKTYQTIINNIQKIIFSNSPSSLNSLQIEEIPDLISKLKKDNDTNQRLIRNIHKLMNFNDEADLFVKINMLLTQQETIEKLIKESFNQESVSNMDTLYCIKELISNQKNLVIIKKQNRELEQQINQMIPASMMEEANDILSKIIKIITGEESDQIKFPMKPSVSIQLLELIQAYQSKNEKNQRNINFIFSKAKESGYSGKNFARAVDFLSNCIPNNENHHYNNQ